MPERPSSSHHSASRMRASLKREIPAILTIFILTLPTLWFAVGIQIYGMVASTAPHCTSNPNSDHFGNSLSNYDVEMYDTPLEWWNTTNFTVQGWENVTISVEQEDVELSAWWVGENDGEATVILVHGIRSCKEDHNILLTGALLANAGFNVLAIDLREHGESSSVTGKVAGGQTEWRDVVAAFDWVNTTKNVAEEKIGVLGFSMGAAITAMAFGEDDRINSIWLDATYYDFERIVRSELEFSGLPTFFAKSGIYAGTFLDGITLNEREPSNAATSIGERHIFVHHNEQDERIPIIHSKDMCEVAKENVGSSGSAQCWFTNASIEVDGYDGLIGHMMPLILLTPEYEYRLVHWFKATLNHHLPEDYSPLGETFQPL